MSSDFWDLQHRVGDHYWLGLSDPAEVLAMYDVNPAGVGTFTDIGVGDLSMARAMKEHGARVTCVDISPTACGRARQMGFEAWTVNDLEKATKADLAIGHLVLQHCPADEAARLFHVPLRKEGRAMFQYVWGPYHEAYAVNQYWHATGEIAAMATKAGRRVLSDVKVGNIGGTEWRLVTIGE